MITYYRHQYELLQLNLQIVNCNLEKLTWLEINDEQSVKLYQDKLNSLEFKKENYLNNLLQSLLKTEITQQNISEVKLCYELIEQYSKKHYSLLFKTHLNRTIENHQKKYGDFLLRNQLKKAVEIEQIITNLERVA
ncbi:hypothetical protein [Paenimyroides viscosum]|uniref:Uncharacterized protein n=1 Tax=Paenimyroides viscosum TaxID=2488729 RepID=A0A3P1B4N7_9FLAO|nr:hypothetical protein [Paenimyroides viscosum]RRA96100.1 hypothetical protein EG242_04235 [Paenimyroides viscosum]